MKHTTMLCGRDEIEKYTRRSWKIIQKWLRHHRFPAKKIDGQWESDTMLIDDWRRDQINGAN